jgi:hypothetical protein
MAGTQPFLVPLIGQGGKHTCWFASAQMLFAWKNGGDGLMTKAERKAAAEITKADTPLDVSRIDAFRKTVGLHFTNLGAEQMGPEGMIKLLDRIKSPLWYAGENNGFCDSPDFGHVVVIRGVKNGHLLFNDPWPPKAGTRRSMKLETFFEKLILPDNPWPVLFIR